MGSFSRRIGAAVLLAAAVLHVTRPEVLVGAPFCGRSSTDHANTESAHAGHEVETAGHPAEMTGPRAASLHQAVAPLDGMDCTHCAPQHCAVHASCSPQQAIAAEVRFEASPLSRVDRTRVPQCRLSSNNTSPPTPPPLSSS